MNAFEESSLAVAQRRLDNALALLEEHADCGRGSLVGLAYAELLHCRGALHAIGQLAALERQLTEPAPAPKLRVVR